MSGESVYLDASALVKLVVAEPESPALRRHLRSHPKRVSASLVATETLRAVMRGAPDMLGQTRRQLRAINLIELDRVLLELAGTLAPPTMRTLDAIHLAAALSLGDDLGELVTYDDRMAQAARTHGIAVASPA